MKVFLLIFVSALSLFAQTQFQSLISRAGRLSEQAQKNAVIDSFINANASKGFPFIEDNTANFIYRGSASSVSLSGDFNNWASNDIMTNLTGTNFFYSSKTFEPDARLDYKIILNSNNWILDPLNPHQILGGFGANSELAMPKYIQPWEIKYYSAAKHGTVETHSLFSKITNTAYQIKVYLPYNYIMFSSTFASVYFQDGYEYIELAGAVNVLDNLLDSMKIEKAIGIFVKPNNRNEEYAGSLRNKYQEFFIKELVPFIDSIYHTTRLPSKRLVLGDSYGANISALISYNYPEVFGNCGLQSGAFQPNNFEALNLLTSGVIKKIKYSSVWGSYEGVYPSMRQLRDYLKGHNYQVDWGEYPEGHSWGLWRANLDKMLQYIFPFPSVGLKDEKSSRPAGYSLSQNYPNPFNPSTTIEYAVAKSGNVKITLSDALGKTAAILVNEFKNAGSYKLSIFPVKYGLSSGIYYYKLEAADFSSSRKMIYLK